MKKLTLAALIVLALLLLQGSVTLIHAHTPHKCIRYRGNVVHECGHSDKARLSETGPNLPPDPWCPTCPDPYEGCICPWTCLFTGGMN